jgi:hypothetical protein
MATAWCHATGAPVPPIYVMKVCAFITHYLLDVCMLPYHVIDMVFNNCSKEFDATVSAMSAAARQGLCRHAERSGRDMRDQMMDVMRTLGYDLLAYVPSPPRGARPTGSGHDGPERCC